MAAPPWCAITLRTREAPARSRMKPTSPRQRRIACHNWNPWWETPAPDVCRRNLCGDDEHSACAYHTVHAILVRHAREIQFPAWRSFGSETERLGRRDMKLALRLAGLVGASLLVSAVSAWAGPRIVSGPGADPACFKPWSDQTKFFQ